MRTVNIDELQSQLSGYLQQVRNGEELVIEESNVPIARILPVQQDEALQREALEREAHLVATEAMTMPKKQMDWDAFFRLPAGNVPHEVAVQALIGSRGDW